MFNTLYTTLTSMPHIQFSWWFLYWQFIQMCWVNDEGFFWSEHVMRKYSGKKSQVLNNPLEMIEKFFCEFHMACTYTSHRFQHYYFSFRNLKIAGSTEHMLPISQPVKFNSVKLFKWHIMVWRKKLFQLSNCQNVMKLYLQTLFLLN